MRKLSVSTLVSLDGVIQDPGGFGEAEYGGWANPYFTDYAQAEALRHLRASDYFLIGRRRKTAATSRSTAAPPSSRP
ncbi:hypothetical protein ABH935_002533 [Catenulispora sp. GAS73]|uniref:hypothetical protein n=1 Tax=Catenulispora sp. GAS73 TaxID=3156269 RepID=UPI003518AC31